VSVEEAEPIQSNQVAATQWISQWDKAMIRSFKESEVSARVMIALLINGMLLAPSGAQEKASVLTGSASATHTQRQQPSSTDLSSSQMLAPAGSPDGDAYPLGTSTYGEGTITIDVWSPATSLEVEPKEASPAKLSADFVVAALQTAFRMQATERRIENSIRRGFPVGEFWIQSDLAGIDDSLILAGLSAANDTDRLALQQLQEQSGRLRLWCEWLIDAKRNLALGDYLTSSWALDNDERFQNTVACSKFLVSMLASKRLGNDNSCL